VLKRKPREIAARVLLRHAEGKEYAETLLARALPSLATVDRHLCQELVLGVIRWQSLLDWLISLRAKHALPQGAPKILLRLGLYQLFWLDRVPDHATVNETVGLARAFGFGPQAGFLNAILRAYARERSETRQRIDALRQENPAVGHSHPEWLCQRWLRAWGPELLERLLAWNNAPPSSYARVNTLRIDAGKLLAQWRDEDVAYDFVRYDWVEENLVFELKAHPALPSLLSFRQGGFYVQDPSTLLAVGELDPQPGERVLDLCAAPGGKLTLIAQRMNNEGQLVARDTAASRLRLLRQNCERLGVTCVNVEQSPERGSAGEVLPRFDRVLVDAPCSNTGVMRRRVDLRWRLRPEEIKRCAKLQLRLLQEGAAHLRAGGTLVYSTCSLEPEENRAVVDRFLEGAGEYKLERDRLLTPFRDQVDGAYVARLRKAGD
jgi:16S rRNA (cytosine967-C5)-methyltransferase